MPAASPAYPALYLYPLNDSFVPKHIALPSGQRVKIGRQTNAKTQPGEKNGYFDSKVLSRQHAEVWEEGNKIFIKDVKSSNGTFINGERLSPESVESEPYELKSDDIVEFGIDIVGEDNKTVVHHKVAARVVCILSEQDAQMAARAEMHQLQHSLQQSQYISSSSQIPSSAPGPGQSVSLLGNLPGTSASPASSAFNFGANNAQQQQQQRRPPATGHQSMVGMGGMGGSMRPPGKSGLTFDHILSRLQGELQKSRETGAELHTLSGAMHEIHDTLGGGLPPNVPPYPHALPPVRSPQVPAPQPPSSSPTEPPAVSATHTHDHSTSSDASAANTAALSDLHSQLQDTQASLSLHVEKIRVLENALKEQEVIRHEVRMLRDMMEVARRGDTGTRENGIADKQTRGDGFEVEVEDEDEILAGGDDDDGMSVGTAVPHELERVDEEDEEQLSSEIAETENGVHVNGILEEDMEMTDEVAEGQEADLDPDTEERRQRRDELGRPHTPEPTNLGMGLKGVKNLRGRHSNYGATHDLNGDTITMIDDLHGRLSALSSQLESALELSSTLQAQHASAQETISALESKVEALEELVKKTVYNAPPAPSESEPSVTAVSVKPETESLAQKITEWKKSVEGQWSNVQEEWSQERERLSRAREEWENKVRQVDSGIEKLEKMQRTVLTGDGSWNGNGDAMHRPSGGGLATPPSPRSLSSDSNKPRRRRPGSRGRSSSKNVRRSEEETVEQNDPLSSTRAYSPDKDGSRSLATPEASVRTLPSSYSLPMSPTLDDLSKTNAKSVKELSQHSSLNMQTAVGFLVLTVAAAAVVYRIKPE